jgi:pantoate--beta-alanine ligase
MILISVLWQGLHEGHLSLVRQARATCDFVAASVFVNPTQFGPTEDFAKYPRTLARDVALLQSEGVDLVFAPATPETMFDPQTHRCFVAPEGFDELPEGKIRPGHFRGVATIVTKLLNVVQPTHAFFGQKDAAQCVLIRRLVADLNLPVQIHVVPVRRETDGLAMSTRNQYLSTEERAAASVVFRGLSRARALFDDLTPGNEVSAETLRAAVQDEYAREPLITEVQYVSVGSLETMEELDVVRKPGGAVVSVAVKLGSCRLIDNIVL